MNDTQDEELVSHYGLHYTQDGVAYLVQGREGNSANFISLPVRSPFRISSNSKWGRKACPHIINPVAPRPDRVHWETFLKIFDDELVQEMLPIPKDRQALVPYLSDPNKTLGLDLVNLSRLSSPIYPLVVSVTTPLYQIMSDLEVTNVAPLVLTGIEPAHQEMITKLALDSRFLPRKLILVGDPYIVVRPPLKRIQTFIQTLSEESLMLLPMETIGSNILKKFARGEKLNAVMDRKEQTHKEQ